MTTLKALSIKGVTQMAIDNRMKFSDLSKVYGAGTMTEELEVITMTGTSRYSGTKNASTRMYCTFNLGTPYDSANIEISLSSTENIWSRPDGPAFVIETQFSRVKTGYGSEGGFALLGTATGVTFANNDLIRCEFDLTADADKRLKIYQNGNLLLQTSKGVSGTQCFGIRYENSNAKTITNLRFGNL